MSRILKLRWKVLVVVLIFAIATVGTLQTSKLVNKVVDWGVESVVEDTMPSAVHIQYDSGSVDEWGRKKTWQGSGVVVSEDGLILTARHVVKEPGEFTVTLADGRKFVTERACVSKNYDVGYLKITDANDLSVAKFGDSDKIKVGGRLLGIGSPWGKQHFNSVTLGILSVVNKSYLEPGWGWKVLFQTDLAANPGNSGGPVFNIDGEVVGIVVGLYGPGNYAGITYCIPSNICESFVKSALLVFALQEVVFVEADERVDALEQWQETVEEDIDDIERRLEE